VFFTFPTAPKWLKRGKEFVSVGCEFDGLSEHQGWCLDA